MISPIGYQWPDHLAMLPLCFALSVRTYSLQNLLHDQYHQPIWNYHDFYFHFLSIIKNIQQRMVNQKITRMHENCKKVTFNKWFICF